MLRTARNVWVGILMLGFSTYAQDLEYKAGYKIIQLYDSSRTYKPNSALTDKLHYRPIDIDLWYPAHIASNDTTILLYDLLHLLESRSLYYDDTRDYAGFTEEFLQYLCANFNCTDHHTWKEIKTESYANAKPVGKTFPLIIYFTALNGMSYENYLLFESLAKHGFVVASISSIGRYPGNMTLEIEDLMEQIHDAKFIANYLAKNNLVSGSIGLVGYSWGGLAATLWSMLDPSAMQAVVSLDGSEQFHYYGDEDDKKLNLIRKSEMFNPSAIKVSYLRLNSDPALSDNLPDSIYYFSSALSGDKYNLQINNATHGHFSCLSIHSDQENKEKYELIQKLTVAYLSDKLKHTDMFYKCIPDEEVKSQSLLFNKLNNKKILKGTIRDEKANTPLQYVNIGILNKDTGTATDALGNFELKFSEVSDKDSLKISMIGYESKAFHFKTILKNRTDHMIIKLKEKTDELDEVVVIEKKLTTKTYGNKTTSKFFGGKFASDDYGSEMAIKINMRHTPAYLDKFAAHISYNMEDTATLRLNIYSVKNGLPHENILRETILLRIGSQTGKIEIDLSAYDIIVEDDFFAALEWVEGSKNSGLVFSAGFVNKGTYYRKASQGRWKKYPMGVGFNITTKY